MASARFTIADLEERIGHRFKSDSALKRALTHASATKTADHVSHYERLEFLGDRVLGLCISQMLFRAFPEAREGELSVRLNALVSGNTCADIADEIGLADFIKTGSDVKRLTGKRMRSVRADVVESLIAALYLDGGLPAAERFVDRFWHARLHDDAAFIRDSKTALQEWAHIHANATPTYTITNRSGPDHDPMFTVEVKLGKIKGAQGKGRSKRAAEQEAAQVILLREGAWVEDDKGVIREKNA
ncbi:MAG: ribonuclease III [Pseudomonadota bacterium]